MIIQSEPDRTFAAKWNFEAEYEMPGGHCSRVYASADRVLKVPFQGEEATSGRIAALAMSGSLGPIVFESDEDSGSILMERLNPGTNLAESGLTENERLYEFAKLALDVRELDCAFGGLMPLAEFMANSKCPFVSELLATSPEPVFLHGDLHHFNILRQGDRWLAIDPKGLYGDPAFEAAAYVRNPIPSIGEVIDLPTLLRGRIEFLEKSLGVEASRIWKWSLAELWEEDELGSKPWGKVKRALLESNLAS